MKTKPNRFRPRGENPGGGSLGRLACRRGKATLRLCADVALLLASVALVGNNKKNLIISSSLADVALLLASVALVGNNKKNLIISSSLADVAQLAEQLHGKE